MSTTRRTTAQIRAGIGGWTYEPWRANFYPAGLAQSRELAYASRQLTTIEVNGTYYSTFKPATFAKWRDETPEDFVFSLKAHRFTTNRRVLAEAGESIARFVESGLAELGPKLGPIVWQFMPTKAFDAGDFGAFLSLLPEKVDGLPLRHALDVRHPSFGSPEYLRLARARGCATVFTDSDDYPAWADLTGSFVYARLMRTQPDQTTGYPPAALDRWAETASLWSQGAEPEHLPRIAPPAKAAGTDKRGSSKARDVFMLFISGAKERAPAAAMALIDRLGPPKRSAPPGEKEISAPDPRGAPPARQRRAAKPR